MFGLQDQLLNLASARTDDQRARTGTGPDGPRRGVAAGRGGRCSAPRGGLVRQAPSPPCSRLVAATGVARRTPARQRRGPRCRTVGRATCPATSSVLLLVRAIGEACAAVLVTAALVHWLGNDWRALLASAWRHDRRALRAGRRARRSSLGRARTPNAPPPGPPGSCTR